MDATPFRPVRWGCAALLLALAGTLTAADKAGDKPQPANYNIPLWEAGKVPQHRATDRSTARSSPCFQPPAGSATALRW
jgi:hypothetical protein